MNVTFHLVFLLQALAWTPLYYLPDQRLLELGPSSGGIYDYFDVPEDLYQQLLAAD